MSFLIIIPARYKSTRFPGKPLAIIKGISMIKRVYDKCIAATNQKNVLVATDSKKIAEHCKTEKINFIMTSKKCLTGTDRVAEVAKKINKKFYVNVQGDEPMISIHDLKKVINYAKKNQNEILNAMCKIKTKKEFYSLSIPKVIFNKFNELIYMSRAPIPNNKKNKFVSAYKQVCIYCYSKKMLQIFSKQKRKTYNEKIEDIEILRFLDLGLKVKMIEVSQSSISVDTVDDLKKVNKLIKNENNKNKN